MPNLTSVGISSGVPNSGTGTVSTIDALMADGGQVTLGATTDAVVTAGAEGSVSAKLRAISRDIISNIVLAAGSHVIGAVTQSGSWVLSAGTALIGKVGIDQTTPGTTNGVQVNSSALPTGAATSSNQAAPNTAAVTNPSSQLTLPSTTTQYGVNTVVASNATAGSVVVPSFAIPNSGGAFKLSRGRLYSDDTLSTAWTGQTVQVDLWASAPTFTNGDRGAYAVATGSANYLGSLTGTFKELAGDGSYAILVLADGNEAAIKLASGTSVFWTLKALTGTSGVTTASKHLAFVPELTN